VDQIERLSAMNEIQQLAYRYAYAVDTRDFPLMLSLWVKTPKPAPKPLLDFHYMQNLSTKYSRIGTSTHFVGNHIIELDSSDRAHGAVYCHCYVEQATFFEQLIIYKDVYERHEGKWLFLTRDHLLWWGQHKTNPMAQPPANWPTAQVGAGNATEKIRVDRTPP